MPELPEVEVTRRSMTGVLEGRTVRALRVYERRLRWPVPRALAATLAGRRASRRARAAPASADAVRTPEAPARSGLRARRSCCAGSPRLRVIRAFQAAAKLWIWRTYRALAGAATMSMHARPLGPALRWATGFMSCALIVGCASPAHGPTTSAQPAPATAAAGAAPAEGRSLPEVELTGPLLFEIVAAEVAVQRGESSAAFATLMKAARDTRDPRLARRATEVALGARAAAQALESAQLWRELDGGSSEAEQTYTSLLVANGRYDDAKPLL